MLSLSNTPVMKTRRAPAKREKKTSDAFMTVPEVAHYLRVSTTWVAINAPRLGGIREASRGQPWRIPRVNIESEAASRNERTTGQMVTDAGARSAAIYKMLEAGKTQSEIVQDQSETPEFVAKVRDLWLKGYQADRTGIDFKCQCGAMANPHTAHCEKCAARSRTLSDAQIANLAGTPLGEHDVLCSGCQKPVLAEGARHVCPACNNRLTVVVHDGRLAIISGVEVLRFLPEDEAVALALYFVPPASREPPAVQAEVMAAPKPAPSIAPIRPRKPMATDGLIGDDPVSAIDSIIEGWDEDFEAMKDAIATGDPDAVMNLTQEQRMKILKRKTRT